MSRASTLIGAGSLLRHNLRRDRVLVPVGIAVLVSVTYASAAATPALYHSVTDQMKAAAAINDQPAIVALYGPILDIRSIGELAMTKMTVLYAMVATVLFVVIVRRHTRVEEESGRAELLGATAVGRDAPLAAAVIEAAGFSLLLGVLTTLAALAGGLPGRGSAWFGLVWALTALVGTGVGAVASQISASARTCGAIAAATIGALYVVRAVGDASSSAHWLSWLSPFGWNTQLRAWSSPRGWVALLYAALIAGLMITAQALRARRDLGSGMVAARPGPARAGRLLAGPLGLCVRMNQTGLILWSLALVGAGVLFGAMTPGLTSMIGDGTAQDMIDRLGGSLIAAILMVLSLLVTVFAIGVITHVAVDESDGRVEEVLATAVSRRSWYSASLGVAVLGSAWLVVLTGAGLWLGYGLAGGSSPSTTFAAALGWLPAVWLIAMVAALAVAIGPRFSSAAWVVFGACATVTFVGQLLKMPRWALKVSPYSDVPQYPATSWAWTPLIVLTAVAGFVGAAAWVRYRSRDIG